jgi:hypothetical protein
MDHRQMLLCLLGIAPERKRVVPVAHFAQAAVPLPTVSADYGARRYVIFDECGERIGVATGKRVIHPFDAGDNAEPETASISEFFDRNSALVAIPPFRAAVLGILSRPNFNSANHRRLMVNALPFTPRATANATFVYFDGMRRANGITVWAHHTGAEFVKHSERRLVSGDAKLALKLNGGLPGRLCCHEIGAPKPRRERHMARLHDCPSGERRICFTGATAQHNRRAGSKTVGLADELALWAREAVRPADRLQITGASAIIREDALKLGKTRWEGCIHG